MFLTMDDFDFKDKVTLVRIDINSPIDPETKRILNDTRIRRHAQTIKELSDKGAKVVVLAHQGRPGSKDFTPLKEHAELLAKAVGKTVKYVDDIYGKKAQEAIKSLKSGEILVLENVRMAPEEMKKVTPEEHAESEFVKTLSKLGDVFVNDAFAAAHRSQASIVGFAEVLPSVAGRIMERELKALGRVLSEPEKPCVYVMGGAKADDSLKISKYVLDNDIADSVLTGGVCGHLFMAAEGVDLGKPNMDFLEKSNVMDLIPGIRGLMNKYPGKIFAPVDVAVEVDGKRKELDKEDLPTEYPIYDIGSKTIEKYTEIIKKAKSIVVSGPMGVYENEEFRKGTKEILQAVADSEAFSLIGGGHTIAATTEFGLADKMSYISTAGGALIEFLMGGKLPGVVALEKSAERLKGNKS